MFDIGFSEVLLIFVIALVVLGPEKLPRVASQVGRWIGRARSMARQFREQLEEEVNLEQVRKAHEQKKPAPNPGTQPDASSPQSGSSSTSSDTPSGGGTSADGQTPGAAPHSGTSLPGTDAAAGGTSAAGTGDAVGSYHGPDPADFRADTFSHAHPTNEYGANPHTSNGAAEDSSLAAPAPAGSDSAQTPVSPAQSQFAFDSRTASEANVAAAQPQSESTADKRADSSEAYAPPRPRDNTPGTDNHGN